MFENIKYSFYYYITTNKSIISCRLLLAHTSPKRGSSTSSSTSSIRALNKERRISGVARTGALLKFLKIHEICHFYAKTF